MWKEVNVPGSVTDGLVQGVMSGLWRKVQAGNRGVCNGIVVMCIESMRDGDGWPRAHPGLSTAHPFRSIVAVEKCAGGADEAVL